jgi:hypothetical protein
MNAQANTAKYIELSTRTYALIVDTFSSATRSRLDYWKSVWQIASRPYASTAIDVRENVDRVSALTNLTVSELHSRGLRTVDFSEKLLAEIGKLQDSARETYRDSVKSNDSTVAQVKDAASEVSVNGFNHRETPPNPSTRNTDSAVQESVSSSYA